MDAGSGEWKESVQLVFEYFCERTPRSFVEQRGTSLVWNYKYAGGCGPTLLIGWTPVAAGVGGREPEHTKQPGVELQTRGWAGAAVSG